ncbi:hypothetical protein DVH24_001061, partial [Malus domestica]
IHGRIYVVPRPSSFVHQHLAPSVGNDTKSYVGSLSFFHSISHCPPEGKKEKKIRTHASEFSSEADSESESHSMNSFLDSRPLIPSKLLLRLSDSSPAPPSSCPIIRTRTRTRTRSSRNSTRISGSGFCAPVRRRLTGSCCYGVRCELLEDLNEKLVNEDKHFRNGKFSGKKFEYQRLCISTDDGGVISLEWPANLDLREEYDLDTTLVLVQRNTS